MNKTIFAVLGLTLASPVIAEEINQTLDADPNGRVIVTNLSGSVEVSGWDRNQVEVTGELGDDVDEFIFERDGRQVLVKVKVPERSWGRKKVSSELVIRVPAGSALEVATVSADIDVSGVNGEQDLQSVSGDITSEAFEADVDAETVSGDVELRGNGTAGDWELSSVSGDINARDLSGTIDAESVSGDIEILNGAFTRVSSETVNGDMDLGLSLRDGGKLDAESVNGSIDIRFQGDVSARFDIETFNGRIRNCFGPKPKRADKYAPGWELSFTEGGGNSRVSVTTLNGSIDICK